MLTQIRSLYLWIKVAVTKILTIDFYNLQKKGKKIFPDEGCLVCCCKETWYLKSCQTSFQKRIQPPLVSVMKQCQKTWLFIIIFSAIRVWKLTNWVVLNVQGEEKYLDTLRKKIHKKPIFLSSGLLFSKLWNIYRYFKLFLNFRHRFELSKDDNRRPSMRT